MKKLCIPLIFLASVSYAKDFGKVHHVFEIKEERFLQMIQRKLKLMDMQKFEEDWKASVKQRSLEPKAVEGIGKSIENSSKVVDITFELPEDAILENGKILYPRGTKINPLDHMDLGYKIYFINGDDRGSLEWIKKENLIHVI